MQADRLWRYWSCLALRLRLITLSAAHTFACVRWAPQLAVLTVGFDKGLTPTGREPY